MCEGGKLLSGINSMYIYSLACVKVKGVTGSVLGSIVARDSGVSCPHGFSMYI